MHLRSVSVFSRNLQRNKTLLKLPLRGVRIRHRLVRLKKSIPVESDGVFTAAFEGSVAASVSAEGYFWCLE